MKRITAIALLTLVGAINIMSGPIHEAAAKGDLEAIKKILKRDKKAIDEEDENDNDNTPLIVAVNNNKTKTVEFLLKNNAYPDKQNRDLHTALYFAVQMQENPNPDIIKLLLLFGANTSLLWSYLPNSKEIDRMFDDQKKRLALFSFWPPDKFKIEKLAKNPNADIFNQRDYKGDTLLHKAVLRDAKLKRASSTETIDFLLKLGADPDVKNRDGLTPYELAVNLSKNNPPLKTQILKIANHIKNSMKTDDDQQETAQALQQLADALTSI